MLGRMRDIAAAVQEAFARGAAVAGGKVAAGAKAGQGMIVVIGMIGAAGYLLYSYPPVQSVGRGEAGIRANRMTGEVTEWRDGSVLVIPGLHRVRVFPLKEQIYRPAQSQRADGAAPFQSVEGLSFGADLQVRYAIDP